MSSTQNRGLLDAFDTYRSTIISITDSRKFWQGFLKLAISKYQNEEGSPDEIYSSVFYAHDRKHDSIGGALMVHTSDFSIQTSELETHREMFSYWEMNNSLLRAYNAMELFLLNAIHQSHFSQTGVFDSRKVDAEIKGYLKNNGYKTDSKNNRHIIQFLKAVSPEINSFLDLKINTDLNTTWENFFELISILRNVIAHNNMTVEPDTHNEIRSKAKDIFERHFRISSDPDSFFNIKANEEQFNNFINLINSLTLNLVKFISGEGSLSFLDMSDAFN
jgi:hypothetical protein